MHHFVPRSTFALLAWLLPGLLGPSSAAAQARGIDFTYGRWWHGAPADAYAASYSRHLFGPLDYGVGLTHLDDARALDDRTQTGGELSVAVGRDGSGLYVVGTSGLAMRHGDRNVDAAWSAGAGYALRPLSFLSVGVEVRYRVEDRNVQGFWQLDPVDRRGVLVLARIAVGGGTPGPTGRGGRGTVPRYDAPRETDVASLARSRGASDEAAEAAAGVVRSALDAMGTPYRWGGSDANGYDCSGLIQFAYGEQGILLPRTSSDQARLGILVEREPAALRPGDILGFAANGRGVSHVGLYVGDGLFIHSSSSGVKLSSLSAADGESRYWRERWAVARRILN